MAERGDIVALVPARGGSKGIPRKNLCVVGGVSLVARAVHCGLAAARVTRTLLSTDDAEIAAAGEAAGAEVVMRPAELATDDAPTIAVVEHVVDQLRADGRPPAAVLILDPTSPFRTPDVVDACVDKLLDGETRTVLTVTQLERNPRYIFAVDGDGDRARRFIERPDPSFARRQDFQHLKRVNGCVYAMRPDNLNSGSIVAEPIRVVEMPPERSINIDTEIDLLVAELVAERYGL